MARFTARSSLTESRPGSQPTRRRANCPPPSSARYAQFFKKNSVSRAPLSLKSPLSYVFVGNLRSDVRNEDLERLFSECGKIMKTDIRCCSGTAVPSVANADTVYASILFASMDGATRALFKDSSVLLGKKIVVAPSFLALPEASQRNRRKPISVLGVNLTKISDNIHHTVDRMCNGGTQIFTSEEEDY